MDPKRLEFSAVAFDLDGTLYPNYRFYARLVPFLLKEHRYLAAFGKARNRLRAQGPEENRQTEGSFYRRQAAYMAEILGNDSSFKEKAFQNPGFLEERTDKIIYRGWEPLFKKVKLFAHVRETLAFFREQGLKLGLLSDFPPENKIKTLGLSGYWDTVLCTEKIGALKPDPRPFQELCRALGFPAEKILYVGNSFSYDVLGAQRAGMKTAWIVPKMKYLGISLSKKIPFYNTEEKGKADFVFHDYRQLCSFVVV